MPDELGAMLQAIDVDKPMALTFRNGLDGERQNVIVVPRKLRQPPMLLSGEDFAVPDDDGPQGVVF